MKYIVLFGAMVIFGVVWTMVTKRYLPSEVVDNENDKYDERQRKMFTEVLARNSVWFVYVLFVNLIFRYLGYWDTENTLLSNYPEWVYLVIIVLLTVMNYFSVRKKYTSSGV